MENCPKLKDISNNLSSNNSRNMAKPLVPVLSSGPSNVKIEDVLDKENTDPRTGTKSTASLNTKDHSFNPFSFKKLESSAKTEAKEEVITKSDKVSVEVEEDLENDQENLEAMDMESLDSDVSLDGFRVDDDLQLDEASSEDEENDANNLDKTIVLTEIADRPSSDSKSDPSTAVAPTGNSAPGASTSAVPASGPSPLIMSSLINNKLLMNINTDNEKLNNDNNGASPMFPQPQVARQERRKLDFSNLENSSPVTSGVSPKKTGSTSSASENFQQRKFFRRCVSLVERGQKLQLTTSSPEINKQNARLQDMTSPLSRPFASFKRPNVPLQPLSQNNLNEQPCKKVRRGFSLKENRFSNSEETENGLSKAASTSNLDSPQIAKPMLQLSLSESEANIKKACSLADEPNLTGDRSRKLSLPTISGSGRSAKSLNNIDCHTLANLINGRYSDKIASFRVLDARYCYEFKGGHIKGAENFGAWDEDGFFAEFLPRHWGPNKEVPNKEEKAHIVIFHCEFSSARGPALMNMLRNSDRTLNKDTYPALYYPECYLLSLGYKEFFANYPELCDPRAYVKMADPKFANEERKFHRKSKSWAPGGTISRTSSSSRLLKL